MSKLIRYSAMVIVALLMQGCATSSDNSQPMQQPVYNASGPVGNYDYLYRAPQHPIQMPQQPRVQPVNLGIRR